MKLRANSLHAGDCPRHAGRRYVALLGGCTVCVEERAATRGAGQGASPPAAGATRPDRAAQRHRALEIRRRDFAVLAAVAALIPFAGDVDGRAAEMLPTSQIAESAQVSRSQVRRSLRYFRAWRVLWLHHQKPAIFEIRFEREVAERLQAAQTSSPLGVKSLLLAHRRNRETVAPLFSTIRKEKAHAENPTQR